MHNLNKDKFPLKRYPHILMEVVLGRANIWCTIMNEPKLQKKTSNVSFFYTKPAKYETT